MLDCVLYAATMFLKIRMQSMTFLKKLNLFKIWTMFVDVFYERILIWVEF